MSVDLAEDLDPDRLRELSTLFPIRCYTCRMVLANKQLPYEELIRQGVRPGEAMTRIGVTRLCCRGNVMSPTVLPAGLLVRRSEEGPPLPTLQLRQELAALQVSPERESEVKGILSMVKVPVLGKREFKTGPGSITVPRVYHTVRTVSSALPEEGGPAPSRPTTVNAQEFLQNLRADLEGKVVHPVAPRLPLQSSSGLQGLPPPLPSSTGLPPPLPSNTGLPPPLSSARGLPPSLPPTLPTRLPTSLPTALPTRLPTALPTRLPTALPPPLPLPSRLPPPG